MFSQNVFWFCFIYILTFRRSYKSYEPFGSNSTFDVLTLLSLFIWGIFLVQSLWSKVRFFSFKRGDSFEKMDNLLESMDAKFYECISHEKRHAWLMEE